MPVEVVFINLNKVRHDLSEEEFARRARRGFQAAGTLIESSAKQIVAPHHYTGRFERGIHTNTEGIGLESLQTTVGVSAGAVPEARPLTYGWPIGTMPNTGRIADWLQHKGSPGDDLIGSAIRVARKIAIAGFSFGRLDTFHRAFDQNKTQISRTIARYMTGKNVTF